MNFIVWASLLWLFSYQLTLMCHFTVCGLCTFWVWTGWVWAQCPCNILHSLFTCIGRSAPLFFCVADPTEHMNKDLKPALACFLQHWVSTGWKRHFPKQLWQPGEARAVSNDVLPWWPMKGSLSFKSTENGTGRDEYRGPCWRCH